MKNTKIEWAHHTFNPWVGCTKVSPACDHCYAENLMDSRMHVVQWGSGNPRKRTSVRNWNDPLRWNAEAERLGVRYRVFCASLADVFDNEVPGAWRHDLFDLIEKTPHLDWLLLTKRIGNVARMMTDVAASLFWMDRLGTGALPPNVWLGATICNQAEADRDIPKLLSTPAEKRFLSMEPLLESVDLEQSCDVAESDVCAGTWSTMADPQRCARALRAGSVALLDWVIVGGESGPHARPMHPDWVRSLRDQCAEGGVPFLFKQWGEWSPIGPEGAHDCATDRSGRVAEPLHRENFPAGADSADGWTRMYRVGKKSAGRLLDGRTWDEVPG